MATYSNHTSLKRRLKYSYYNVEHNYCLENQTETLEK